MMFMGAPVTNACVAVFEYTCLHKCMRVFLLLDTVCGQIKLVWVWTCKCVHRAKVNSNTHYTPSTQPQLC